MLLMVRQHVPHGLGVRIPDSHSGGPGSIPGAGGLSFLDLSQVLGSKSFPTVH